jgi:hypothetical protein
MNPFVRFGLLGLCVVYLGWRVMRRWRAASASAEAIQGSLAGAAESLAELRNHPRLSELLAPLAGRYRVTFDEPKTGEHQIRYLTLMSPQGAMLSADDPSGKWLTAYLKGDGSPKRFQAALDLQTGEQSVNELGMVQWSMVVPPGYR